MTEQSTTLFNRISSFFKRDRSNGSVPPEHNTDLVPHDGNPEVLDADLEPRSTFLRPWAKRDAAIEQLQTGVTALSDLMGSIRENLEKQSKRQDELMSYLKDLPGALQSLPENTRAQGETLKQIHQQLREQTTQQGKLGEVLERIHQADSDQRRTLDALQGRVETINEHDEQISRSLNSVGDALQSVSRSSESSTQVLEQLKENFNSRDNELERVLKRQNTRFTTLLTVAIILSISALAAVSIFGYLVYGAITHAK